MIADSTTRDAWMDKINEYKEKFADSFTSEKEELDYQMEEPEIKYMLTEEFEKERIETNIGNYNFNKLLKFEPLKFDEVYALDEETNKLVDQGEVEWVYYGRAKVVRRNSPLSFEKYSSFPGGDLLKSSEYFIAMALHKKIPEKIIDFSKEKIETIDKTNFEEVNSSRRIKDKLWMEYNYIYLFNMSAVKGNKKVKDEIFPYVFLVDPRDFENIECLNSSKLAIQFSNKEASSVVFVFNQILEAYRFYRYSIKARENMQEIYHIGAHTIRVNVDICLNFSEKLVLLRNLFARLSREVYESIRLKEKESRLKKFSEELHRYMVGFNCKPTIEHKYLAIFLEQYQAYYYEQMLTLLNEANDNEDDEEKENLVLSLINNCKFHEEFLKKWKVVDRRINNTTKVTLSLLRYL